MLFGSKVMTKNVFTPSAKIAFFQVFERQNFRLNAAMLPNISEQNGCDIWLWQGQKHGDKFGNLKKSEKVRF